MILIPSAQLAIPTMASSLFRIWLWTLLLCANHVRSETSSKQSDVAQVLVRVDGESAIAETDPDFICATIDWWPPAKCDYGTCSWGNASLLNLDLENPLLANAVKAFNPLKIRLGGSLQDKVIYNVGKLKKPCLTSFVWNKSETFYFSGGCLLMHRWDALNAFFNKTGASVAFGLNALNGKRLKSSAATGPWKSSNARDFIQYTVDHGYKIQAWELGNELSGTGIGTSITAQQYAADVIELHNILNKIYKNQKVKPLLVAPDGFFDANWFTEFIKQTGPRILNVVTHHIYNLGPGVDKNLTEKILDPSFVNQAAYVFQNLQSILKSHGPGVKAWVGESGGAYNSGHDRVTNAFEFSFWYLDQLGISSKFNTKSYCRQSLIGGNYGLLNTTTFVPNPDYYSALLWHRLMGTRVLSTNSTGTKYVRAYAHCAKNSEGVTLLLINFSKHTRAYVRAFADSKTSTQKDVRFQYHLTAKDGDLHSQTVLLNGKILNVTAAGEIPFLPALRVHTWRVIRLAPLSIAFVHFPYVRLPACRT